MRFEVTLKRDKMKSMQNIFKMTAALLKTKNNNFVVQFIYLSVFEEIRILVKRDEAPILIVLKKQLFYKINGYSKSNQEENSIITFDFKQGLTFFEEILIFLKEDQSANMVLESENSIYMKIAKQKDFRSLELKNKERVRKIEIEKPTTSEEKLSYSWIDGAKDGQTLFKMNTTFIVQMLKFVAKGKTCYPIQTLEEKVLYLQLNFEDDKKGIAKLSPQAKPSKINASGLIQVIKGNKRQYLYEIKIDDNELLIQALKSESLLNIDSDKDMTIIFEQQNIYQCQISLKNLVKHVLSEEYTSLKLEM